MRLAALGLSYSKVGMLLGFTKSTLCKWLKQEGLDSDGLDGQVLELDGLWTRTTLGKAELKVVRDGAGEVMASFESWERVLDSLYQRGLDKPVHIVSDGDKAIAEAIAMVYGSNAPHQLCQFHLLREYQRNTGFKGWQEARALLDSQSSQEAQIHARRLLEVAGKEAEYWCRKVLEKGLTFLRTAQPSLKTTSRLERYQRELRRREHMGTCWSPHNLLVLLQQSGLVDSTT